MVKNKDLQAYKKKYHMYRHHAWAGSVLLAVLIAVRGFLELSSVSINDWIIVIIGLFLVFYILISVFLTYKYSSGLKADSETVIEHKYSDEVEKERLKLEKKLAKNKAKIQKKAAKEEHKKKKNE